MPFFSGREAITPVDLILLKDCLWHDLDTHNLVEQQLQQLMGEQAYQQRTLLFRLQQLNVKRQQYQQEQSEQQAFKVERQVNFFGRKPHHSLPESLTAAEITLMLQKPLLLHDYTVTHVVIDREALASWLQKGGEIRGKLNGVGFSQHLDMEVDERQHLIIRDISLQSTVLSLPGVMKATCQKR
ncbi:hypothetical protein OS42_05970 [Dickeya oryzae]